MKTEIEIGREIRQTQGDIDNISLSSCKQKIEWLEDINKELLEACKDIVRIWEGPRERAAIEFAQAIIKSRKAINRCEGREEV